MMIESGYPLAFGAWGSPAITLRDAEKNQALECFLLHFRNLRAFLCPLMQRLDPDDVIASDFLRMPKPVNLGDPNKIGDDKERLDKMLAHISYSRTRYIAQGNTDWLLDKMASAMLDQIDVFLDKIPEYMKPWFPERTWMAEKRSVIDSWAFERKRRASTTTADSVVRTVTIRQGVASARSSDPSESD